jgi:hypothetical protein
VNVLAAVVHALPSRRREWGQAMLAELAAIDDPRARRRYARSCVRAVLADPATVGAPLFFTVFAVVTLALAASFESTGVRVETAVLVAVVGVLAWAGRRTGVLGPVGPGRVARGVRGGGYLLVAAVQSLFMLRGGGGRDDPGGWWIAELSIALYLVAFLIVTSQRAADSWHLRVLVISALGGLVGWCVPLLLLSGVHGQFALWVLPVVAVGVLTVTRHSEPAQILYATLGAVTATCLLIFVIAAGVLGHDLDPYVAVLLFGALLAAALVCCGVRLGRAPRAGSPSYAAASAR